MREPKSGTRGVRAARTDDAWLARLDSFAPDAQLVWQDEQAQLLLEHVWWRDLGRCGICGEELSLVGAELDWVVPAGLGKMDLAEGTAYVGTTFQSRRHRRQNLQAAHPHCAENKLGAWEIAQWRSHFMPLTDVAEGLFATGSLWLPAPPVELPDSMVADLQRQRQRNWAQYIKQRARIGNYSPEAGRRRRGVARVVDMSVAFTIAGLLPSWEALDNVLDDLHYGLILAGVWVLYEWPQSALWGRTLGKRLTGIRIVRAAGDTRIGWVRTALRLALPATAVALLSWFGIAIALLIYATCLLNPAKRGLHDLISRSKVVED
ncbi:RDD family protein [Candidatus Poriferisodalis sp.]|uniref:RDD family protein n=1 Tax=Candidatus Poriferisodalis sp. TaxID=3101277 RepID=UPI003B0107CC